jgi:hypothetical protein
MLLNGKNGSGLHHARGTAMHQMIFVMGNIVKTEKTMALNFCTVQKTIQ